jgi:putative phosphoribosyl transferase
MIFESREEAGQRLGQLLREKGIAPDLVLGLPRGGVVVAGQVAEVLQCPLDVLVVRKIGHPWHREFALGAMAEDGTVLLDAASEWIDSPELNAVIAEERTRLRDYSIRFHPTGPLSLQDRRVLIVDDGLATGATTEVAVRSARKQAAAQVIVAVPVASDSAVHRLAKVADQVVAVTVDPGFQAVGLYYHSFEQSTDDEVLSILARYPRERSGPSGAMPAGPANSGNI